ncbi:MAG TPA: hypothetical protein DDZ81_05380 [Acetobacteraceae bacterium]|jgi:peptidyl-prolyl cis-trans isomerase C|nr:hypothetical protein [Acetobacteraceae bacterium]
MLNRNHRYLLAILPLALSSGIAFAQSGIAPAPSPFAPGDLKRPIFDTANPSYDTAGKAPDSANTVLAEVDGRSVTLGDVADAIRKLPANVAGLPFPDVYPGVLSRLIRQQALVIRAQQLAIDEDTVVRRRMKAASDQVLANEFLIRQISPSITEAALLERYKTEVVGQPGPEEVHLRVIMLRTEREANDIIGELRTGADFAALAKRSSIDSTAAAGGDAGFATLEQLTPEVGAVVFSLEPGHFTAYPVRGPETWFVLKVEERRRQPTRPFLLAREQLRQEILREGVAPVIEAAVAAATVRQYDVSGKEDSGPPEGAGRQ